MAEEWTNWSGSVKFKPAEIVSPGSEREVKTLVERVLEQKKKLRIAGAGHSSMPLVETDEILLEHENLKGITSHDVSTHQVKILPGTHIAEAGRELVKLRIGMHNTGDVDYQRLAGAFGTGTHGSGKNLQNLPAMLLGFRMVDGCGIIHEYSVNENPEMIQAARVALGAFGVFTELTIQVLPAEKFARREFCTHVETCLQNLDELINQNRMFDFYWYPRNDLVKLRLCNATGEGMQEVPYGREVKHQEGWLYKVLPQSRTLRFEEMEYALPFDAGVECFKEVRKRIKEKHRHYVGWRVLFRTVAADDSFLSPFYRRDAVTIAVLQNNGLEYKSYFNDIEPIFRAYGGRPHWGKKHSLKANELCKLYPEWGNFLKIRKQLDPNGIFLNDYLKKILGV